MPHNQDLDSHVTFCFQFWLFFYILIPKCMRPKLKGKQNLVRPRYEEAGERREAPTYKEIYEHYNELKQQLYCTLSLRNLVIMAQPKPEEVSFHDMSMQHESLTLSNITIPLEKLTVGMPANELEKVRDSQNYKASSDSVKLTERQ